MTDAVPAGRYVIDPTHSSVTPRIKHFGLAWYTGRFAWFSAQGKIKRWAFGLDLLLSPLLPDEVQLILEAGRVLQPSGTPA